ncbi:ABC transporter substrate-binding protein [Vibrio sp. M60_M31a]
MVWLCSAKRAVPRLYMMKLVSRHQRLQNVKSVSGNHGNLISFEYIADAQPEVLLVLDREQAIGQSNGKAKALFDNDLVKSTPAAKNGRVMFLKPRQPGT